MQYIWHKRTHNTTLSLTGLCCIVKSNLSLCCTGARSCFDLAHLSCKHPTRVINPVYFNTGSRGRHLHLVMNSSPYPVQEVDIDTDHWEQFKQDGQYHAAAQQELQDLRQRVQELSRQMSQMGASSSGHAHTSSE